MRDNKRTNKQTVKIELLSQWKLEAEFRNCNSSIIIPFPLSTSFLQVLLVPGQSGANGPSATPLG